MVAAPSSQAGEGEAERLEVGLEACRLDESQRWPGSSAHWLPCGVGMGRIRGSEFLGQSPIESTTIDL